jgi:hypothetical protein
MILISVFLKMYEANYIENLLSINKNLRGQIEFLHKLLKMKLKTEMISDGTRLEKILNELEIIRSSLTFSLQKQTEIVSNK